MTYSFIKITETNNISVLTLNRSDKRNALHGPMIAELSQALTELTNRKPRVLILKGEGEHFCSGGDIAWMQKMIDANDDENYSDALQLADLLLQLHQFPAPTIVLAHGTTLGGGMGLVAAADMALADNNAEFGFPEVKIGITPSVISPYVIRCMGERQASYYFLTGERFAAEEAKRLGLIHRIIKDGPLLEAGLALANNLVNNGPVASREIKKLMSYVAKQTISSDLAIKTAEHLAERRIGKEGQEGLRAFLEKRAPNY